MTSSILLTGANGFVGQGVLKRALLQPGRVTCVTRAPLRIGVDGIAQVRTVVLPTLGEDSDWSDCLKDITTVVHCAARVHVGHERAADPLAAFRRINVALTLNLARQAAAVGVRQFIFISSVKVNGECTPTDQPYTEHSTPCPQDAYGMSKHEAETALQQLGRCTGMAITIIRPPLVYGAGVRANFQTMWRWVRRGVPLPLGATRNRRSFVFLDNLVSLILCCVNNPNAYNQVFLVSDGEDLSTTELLRASAHALNVRSRLWPCPALLLTLAAAAVGKRAAAERLCQSLQVDISKARRVLDWAPPYTVEQGLRALAAHPEQA